MTGQHQLELLNSVWDDDDLRHLAHMHGWMTEFEALAAVSPRLKSMKADIFRRLGEAGRAGMTPDEYCDLIGGLINTVRRRFTDLWKEGVIRHHPDGTTRPNRNKNECVVWVLGRDPVAVECSRRVSAGAVRRERDRLLETQDEARAFLRDVMPCWCITLPNAELVCHRCALLKILKDANSRS